MSYTAVYSAPRRRDSGVHVMLLVILCVVGGLLAMSLALNGPSVSLAPSQRLPGIADRVRTSFGFVEVEHAVVAASGPLAGAMEVSVAVALRNDAEMPLLFSSAQIELVDRRGHVVPPTARPTAPSLLQPKSAMDLAYQFVTTGAARPFTVRFVDRTTRRTFDISLGALGCVGVGSCPGGNS